MPEKSQRVGEREYNHAIWAEIEAGKVRAIHCFECKRKIDLTESALVEHAKDAVNDLLDNDMWLVDTKEYKLMSEAVSNW